MRTPWTHGNRLLGYDPTRRRVWICGQRVHHGATGILLAALGAALVAHDWKDRPVWFSRGAQDVAQRLNVPPGSSTSTVVLPPVRSSTSA